MQESNDSSKLAQSLTLEHIDPRNHRLISGLKNEFNEIVADYSYNSRKTNRFVPYRVCEYSAPTTFGDIGEFLINGQWVICEFGGKTWWDESNIIGHSQTKPASDKQKKSAQKTGLANKGRKHSYGHGKQGAAVINKIQWRCLETGYVSTSGPLSRYQKKRGIDTSLRERIS